jgi:hypothetical protein
MPLSSYSNANFPSSIGDVDRSYFCDQCRCVIGGHVDMAKDLSQCGKFFKEEISNLGILRVW